MAPAPFPVRSAGWKTEHLDGEVITFVMASLRWQGRPARSSHLPVQGGTASTLHRIGKTRIAAGKGESPQTPEREADRAIIASGVRMFDRQEEAQVVAHPSAERHAAQ